MRRKACVLLEKRFRFVLKIKKEADTDEQISQKVIEGFLEEVSDMLGALVSENSVLKYSNFLFGIHHC